MAAQREEILNALKREYDLEYLRTLSISGLSTNYWLETTEVLVKMTATAPGCPVGNYIVGEARRAIGRLERVKEIDVELVYGPLGEKA